MMLSHSLQYFKTGWKMLHLGSFLLSNWRKILVAWLSIDLKNPGNIICIQTWCWLLKLHFFFTKLFHISNFRIQQYLFYYCLIFALKYHNGLSMYMEPLKKWWQHGPDSNFTISVPLYFKPSFDESPIFATLYWKAVQDLKHIYVVKNTSSEMIDCLDFVLPKPFLAFRDHLNTFCLF